MQDTTITAGMYHDTLMRLQKAIKLKRPSLLTHRIILLRENTTQHWASVTQAFLKSFKWIIFHNPAHSLDLFPSDYQLFKDQEKFLRGTHFQNEDKLKTAVLDLIQNVDEKYLEEGLLKLVY